MNQHGDASVFPQGRRHIDDDEDDDADDDDDDDNELQFTLPS